MAAAVLTGGNQRLVLRPVLWLEKLTKAAQEMHAIGRCKHGAHLHERESAIETVAQPHILWR